jgi:predicted dinucleotide-binding enzyme
MNIGIIGTGHMGRTLGLGWARAGHRVLFGSRDLEKAKSVAAGVIGAEAGDFDAAAAFGDVVLYTVRGIFPSQLLRAPQALAGKVVIDCNNSDIPGYNALSDPRAAFRFAPPVPSLAERLAADVPDARVVKAFNTIPDVIFDLDRERLAAHRVSVFLCADDEEAKAVVKTLVEALGFVAVDSGELERAQLVESVADFLRFQIIGMGLGPFATLSLNVLEAS